LYRDLINAAFSIALPTACTALNNLFLHLINKEHRKIAFACLSEARSKLKEILDLLQNEGTLVNRIERRLSHIVKEVQNLGLLKIFPRTQTHYDLAVILITENTDLSSIISATTNFSKTADITHSKTVVLHNSSKECERLIHNLINEFSTTNSSIFDSVEKIAYKYTDKNELVLSMIADKIGDTCNTILIVSDYGVLHSLNVTLEKKPLGKTIELFCGEEIEDIHPSKVFMQNNIKTRLLDPLSSYIDRSISGRD